jgi:hypothetical protein
LFGLMQLCFSAAQVGLCPFQFIAHDFPFLWHPALTAAFIFNVSSNAKFVKRTLSAA